MSVASSLSSRPWLAFALLAVVPAVAFAAPPPTPSDGLQYQRVVFTATLGRNSLDTQLRRDAAVGVPGTLLSGEDDLGLARSKLSGTAEFTVRTRNRHRFRVGADYLAWERQATATPTVPFVYDGITYGVTDAVQTTLDLRRYSATYLYSPFRNERFELSVGLGVDLIDFQALLAVPERGVKQQDTGTAPVPRAGIEGLWRISPHWYAEGRASYVQGTVAQGSGKLKAFSANVVWAWQPGMAFQLGYQRYDLQGESFYTSVPGKVHLKTGGPQLAVRVGF